LSLFTPNRSDKLGSLDLLLDGDVTGISQLTPVPFVLVNTSCFLS
jgi:hypothetical protein